MFSPVDFERAQLAPVVSVPCTACGAPDSKVSLDSSKQRVISRTQDSVSTMSCPTPNSAPDRCDLRDAALRAWCIADPIGKADAAIALGEAAVSPQCHVAAQSQFADQLRPGRPSQPRLVHPRDVPQRGVGTDQGRAALLHAIAHIEFNAIDLALDAVWRFDAMPQLWYLDWASVAFDEARHFRMLSDELTARGHRYGDFEAHDGMWEMAMKTRHDPLARMALVPRLMEARGLDVTPLIIGKLEQAGDPRAVSILEVILREEVGHVAIGNRWYEHLCMERGIDPIEGWDTLASQFGASRPRGPFNEQARLSAGFSQEELNRWR